MAICTPVPDEKRNEARFGISDCLSARLHLLFLLDGIPFLFGKKTAPNGFMLAVLAVALVLLTSASVRADDDEAAGSTNREKRPIEELFKTDVVYPQQKGELEVELA